MVSEDVIIKKWDIVRGRIELIDYVPRGSGRDRCGGRDSNGAVVGGSKKARGSCQSRHRIRGAR